MNEFIYLIGPPGAGKSTLMRELTFGMTRAEYLKPIAHSGFYRDGKLRAVEIGKRRPDFSGTDALAMNVLPKAIAFVKMQPHHMMLAEGDRLACDAFFEAVVLAGYRLSLFMVDGPDGELEKRRMDRAVKLGKPTQNLGWVQGRTTKARRLQAKWDAPLLYQGSQLEALRLKVQGLTC